MILSLSIALSPWFAFAAEPFVNWAEMKRAAWTGIGLLAAMWAPIVSIWFMTAFSAERAYACSDIAKKSLKLRVMRLYLSSFVLTVFGLGQIVLAARDSVDLLEGVPGHLMSGW